MQLDEIVEPICARDEIKIVLSKWTQRNLLELIGFLARELNSAKRIHIISDEETLAVVEAIENLGSYLSDLA